MSSIMEDSSRTGATTDLLAVFNHITLPIELPTCSEEAERDYIDAALTNRMLKACDVFAQRENHHATVSAAFDDIGHSLRVCCQVNKGHFEKSALLDAFRGLRRRGGVLILHVAKQNAGLFIRNSTEDPTVIFEVMEASPMAAEVLAAGGALQWDLPGRTAQIPAEEFDNECFQDQLASLLVNASMESLGRFAARAVKASKSVIEERDVPECALISQMLMSVLQAIGSHVEAPRCRKRVRDDVSFINGEKPWRRAPMWLILRVAVQRRLSELLGNDVGWVCYKLLICSVLGSLLHDIESAFSPEKKIFLRQKLCRRLAKLERHFSEDFPNTGKASLARDLFAVVRPFFQRTIEDSAQMTQKAWEHHKATTTRQLPNNLPRRSPLDDQILSLVNSREHLKKILNWSPPIASSGVQATSVPNPHDSSFQDATKFAARCFELENCDSDELSHLETEVMLEIRDPVTCQKHCAELSKRAEKLMTSVGNEYDANPEEISKHILRVIQFFCAADRYAIRACPLVRQYHPLLRPEPLDALQLPEREDVNRLRDVQRYLSERCSAAQFKLTILDHHKSDTFALAYFEQHRALQNLQARIQKDSRRSRQQKKEEWQEVNQTYDDLTDSINGLQCLCTFDMNGKRDVRGCERCWMWRQRTKLRIKAHEEYLPSSRIQAAAVVFELGIPQYLAAYRDLLWRIFFSLGQPSGISRSVTTAASSILNYAQLSHYQIEPHMSRVSLKSSKKSFLTTHYRFMKGKVELADVLLPFGLDLHYYDHVSNVWIKNFDFSNLTFQHLCGVRIPKSVQECTGVSGFSRPPAVLDSFSSYDSIANQTKVPSTMSIQEFMAIQRLLSGQSRRWYTMLVELRSSNINFNTEETMHLFNGLAVQAGSTIQGDFTQGIIHEAFKETDFCTRLVEEIAQRLEGIRNNSRQTFCMEILITLALQLRRNTSGPVQREAYLLLLKARQITLRWISDLVKQARQHPDANAARIAAEHEFWIALLCRRTFAVFLADQKSWSADDLKDFIRASLALQENFVTDLDTASPQIRNMLVRDMKMAWRLRKGLQECIEKKPQILNAAFDMTLSPDVDSSKTTYTVWQGVQAAEGPISGGCGWFWSVVSRQAQEGLSKQTVHYNVLEGHLLVNGNSLGKLPTDIRNSSDVKMLFGNEHLLTMPSHLSGMSHTLVSTVHRNEVHFGCRDGMVIIRTISTDGFLEYVPRSLFRSQSHFDLPNSMTEGCSHWLDLSNRCVKIRRNFSENVSWRTKANDWTVDLRTRKAKRRKVTLVDPQSQLAQLVYKTFNGFELPEEMTIYQPENGNLHVEMRRMGLNFQMGYRGRFILRQLAAELDPDQDAGTFYGLESKLVLRDQTNPQKRFIIVAMGLTRFKRYGVHVKAIVENNGKYARYEIDPDLGRLTCPAEPQLLYWKAYLHAITSFPIADPLTGRTGTEEAFHMLCSGTCQPWTGPLSNAAVSVLHQLKDLSPRRSYYPIDKRLLQSVRWNSGLTAHIQHEGYRLVIPEILAKAERLAHFVVPATAVPAEQPQDPTLQLTKRAFCLRATLERREVVANLEAGGFELHVDSSDRVYRSRDRTLEPAARVYRVVQSICGRFAIEMKNSLIKTLLAWKCIGGFHRSFPVTGTSLSDLLDSDICMQWGSLVELCRAATPQNLYHIVFRLGFLSFGQKPNMDVIFSLVAFARLEELQILPLPSGSEFSDFKQDNRPTENMLTHLIKKSQPENELFGMWIGKKKGQRRKRHISEGQRFAEFIVKQWPNEIASIEGFQTDCFIVRKAMELIQPYYNKTLQNQELAEYIDKVQAVLNEYNSVKSDTLSMPTQARHDEVAAKTSEVVPTMSNLLRRPCPRAHNLFSTAQANNDGAATSGTRAPKAYTKEAIALLGILEGFTSSNNQLRKRYGTDLVKSLNALAHLPTMKPPKCGIMTTDKAQGLLHAETVSFREQTTAISKALCAGDASAVWLQLGNLWPCVTPTSILPLIASIHSDREFGEGTREAVVLYGVRLAQIQRLRRVHDATLREDKTSQSRMLQEMQNPGRENWKPLEEPDWLLLELESNMTIRRKQVAVARATISPALGKNSVLQLNMGEGKTSVIMPMVVAVLANRRQLCRLVIPKALVQQTAQTLQARIGGLIGREVRSIPFSRRTSTGPETIALYQTLHKEILERAGCILTTPEHILSFEMSGLQRFVDDHHGNHRSVSSKHPEHLAMIQVKDWLVEHSRDVLDESDFSLAVKTQLIYPSGKQSLVDGHPQRWEVVERLLELVEDHIDQIAKQYPRSLVVSRNGKKYPHTYFLQRDAEVALQNTIINEICEGRTGILRFVDTKSSLSSQASIKRVLSGEQISEDDIVRAVQFSSDPSQTRKDLLLVRGLLEEDVLLSCLKKRPNVQYGLHHTRDPIAVPFEAKGVPSEQAEFGHPDVAIMLTCLAFYHSGLAYEQFKEDLAYILNSDDPTAEYDRWTHGVANLPEQLAYCNLNFEDDVQVEFLWRELCFHRSVANHYLNFFVFPRYARQFEQKMQLSAWDLARWDEENPDASMADSGRTTGFSGTNDNRQLLPLTITQDDLPSLHQTNAEVLTYLLRVENQRYTVMIDRSKQRYTEERLLRCLNSWKQKTTRNEVAGIRILIDAGAYIQEMRNEELARAWLSIDTGAKGAVFFDKDNKAKIALRVGNKTLPLLASPFADNLEECLVYLDEAHTRGTDLKLPHNAVGAVTLSLGQTKDHTVQAAMRLRQLGTTQSVVFLAPPEVDQSIADLCALPKKRRISSMHVVKWLLEQTCRANEQLQHLYFAQGAVFCRQRDARMKNRTPNGSAAYKTELLETILEKEYQTLENLYVAEGHGGGEQLFASAMRHPLLKTFMTELRTKMEESFANSTVHHSSHLEEVEQEREVQNQVEQVRQTQKPRHYRALAYPGMHKCVSLFLKTGHLMSEEKLEHVFAAVATTTLGKRFGIKATTSRLFVSPEFMRTVELMQGDSKDSFVRPVEWILWAPATETAMVLIPEEAEEAITYLRAQPDSPVHLILYAPAVNKRMTAFSTLDYYSLQPLRKDQRPPHDMATEIGILGGQLYFDYSQYSDLTRYLRLDPVTLRDLDDAASGEGQGIFCENPQGFLLEWLTLCRKGQNIMHTPMGYLCQRRPLRSEHHFFAANVADDAERQSGPSRGERSQEEEESDLNDGFNENELDADKFEGLGDGDDDGLGELEE